MAGDITIETERLALREFRPGDWESVHEYATDPEVYRHMPWGPNTEDETRAFIERAISSRHRDPRLHFELAVTMREDDRLIGGGGIRVADEGFRTANMGYCLRRDSWGEGLATEAAAGLVGFGFERLGLHRIWATCDTRNTRSARVLEKVGLELEGTMRDDTWLRGQWRSSHLYSILESK
ncbi:MAG: GNAT family N-acetyltransferase [Candidatus Eisenbacteria bacterium]|nr:GNAT family N-acetyltransferase [Candidatus Eisenbacteria bacterium]